MDQQTAGGDDAVIRGYGISMTTLEEVFMRIGQQQQQLYAGF